VSARCYFTIRCGCLRAGNVPKFDLSAGLFLCPGESRHYGNRIASIWDGGQRVDCFTTPTHWLSAVADLGGYHANNILGTGSRRHAFYLSFSAPRVSYRHSERVTPFGQVLFGDAHIGGHNGLGFSSSKQFVCHGPSAEAVGRQKCPHRFSLRPVSGGLPTDAIQ